MSITAIKIGRLFDKENVDATKSDTRARTIVTLAIVSMIPVPTAGETGSQELRQYFLEQAAALMPCLDDIREVVMMQQDQVLANAFNLWDKRYRMVVNCDGFTVVSAGEQYTAALNKCMPEGDTLTTLSISGKDVDDVASFMRSYAGQVTQEAPNE